MDATRAHVAFWQPNGRVEVCSRMSARTAGVETRIGSSATCPCWLTGHLVMGRPAGAAEVDVGCTDPSQSNEQWRGECGDSQEYHLVRQEISD